MTREFTDLTRAARVKTQTSRQKHRQTTLYRPHPHLAKPAAKRTPARGEQRKKPMAAKMRPKRARRAALYRRDAKQSARQAFLPDRCDSGPRARSRATQTSTDVETSKTAQPTAVPTPRKGGRRPRPSTASSGRLHRDGAAERRSPTRSAKPRARKSSRVRRRLPRHERDG